MWRDPEANNDYLSKTLMLRSTTNIQHLNLRLFSFDFSIIPQRVAES